jgi:lysophospholipase L1-like esterase
MHPNVALFLIGLNDVALAAANWFDVRDQTRDMRTKASDWLVLHSELAAIAQNFWRARQANRYALPTTEMDYTALATAGGSSGDLGRKADRFAPEFDRRVEDIVRVSRAAHIEPVLITQPALYGFGSDPTTGVDLSRRRVNEFGNGAEAWSALEAYNKVTRDVANRDHVLLIDLAHMLPKDSIYFSDLVHFSKRGAKEVAALISVSLRPMLKEIDRNSRRE